MASSTKTSSLNCELRIIRAKNVDFTSKGSLFVRYHLLTENGRRICLNSREIPSTTTSSDTYWNESITLECLGDEDAMDRLKQQSVVFELRWRKASALFGKFGGSKLLFRAEIGWKEVLDSAEFSLERWVTADTRSKYVPEGVIQPALQIGMKVEAIKRLEMGKRCWKWNECGCRHGECNVRDEDVFALAEAFAIEEALCDH